MNKVDHDTKNSSTKEENTFSPSKKENQETSLICDTRRDCCGSQHIKTSLCELSNSQKINKEYSSNIVINLKEKSSPFGLDQVFSSLIGASIAFGFALWLARRQRKTNSTELLINEYSSRETLKSRFITSNVFDRVRKGNILLRSIAMSSLQGCPKSFKGRKIEGLTEHEHISHVIGFYRKLALNFKYNWVNKKHVVRAIGGSLQWSLPFLLELANETERLANEEYTSERSLPERASWVFDVRFVKVQLKKYM